MIQLKPIIHLRENIINCHFTCFITFKTVLISILKEKVTEKLKADNAMLWVGKMYEIQARAREIVNGELIYSQAM